MKELRSDADDGVLRAAFAFDPKREAIILAAAEKPAASMTRGKTRCQFPGSVSACIRPHFRRRFV